MMEVRIPSQPPQTIFKTHNVAELVVWSPPSKKELEIFRSSLVYLGRRKKFWASQGSPFLIPLSAFLPHILLNSSGAQTSPPYPRLIRKNASCCTGFISQSKCLLTSRSSWSNLVLARRAVSFNYNTTCISEHPLPFPHVSARDVWGLEELKNGHNLRQL